MHITLRWLAASACAALVLGGCAMQAGERLTPRTGGPAPQTDTGDAEIRAPVRHDAAVATASQRYVLSSRAVRLPDVDRELRGLWVATVGNMDWPSRRNLGTAGAQRELLRILDLARDNNFNAVILQVRPMADAFYASELEPWSDYLTGTSGGAPEPFWDPLAFAIEAAHERGLELHAWFNPFRAGFVAKQTPLHASHVTRAKPHLVVRYGTHYWMDPGLPEARRHSLNVIRDVVARYDVDAIHLDDYFYPYQERNAANRVIPFPDDASWQRFGEPAGMSRAEWRRSNIDGFIEQLYVTVRETKPHVRVGISPFGIWRPGHPEGVRGLDAFAELYADARKWLRNGWLDYVVPQLYWPTRAPQQDYVALLEWWVSQNVQGRHVYAGLHPNRVENGRTGWPLSEIEEQVRLTRENPVASGNVHFSATSMLRNASLTGLFRDRLYTQPALPPASGWLSSGPLPRPTLEAVPDRGLNATLLRMDTGQDVVAHWLVHARDVRGRWQTHVVPGALRAWELGWTDGAPPDLVAVVPVDRAGVEGLPAVLELTRAAGESAAGH